MRQLSVLNNASNQAVHRDVTPDNLLLTIEAAGPIVRLIHYESGCFSTASQNPVSKLWLHGTQGHHGSLWTAGHAHRFGTVRGLSFDLLGDPSASRL